MSIAQRWKSKVTKPETLPAEIVGAIPGAYKNREAGNRAPCPVCIHRKLHSVGHIRLKRDPRTGAAYYCRRCRTVIMVRAINSLMSAGIIPQPLEDSHVLR